MQVWWRGLGVHVTGCNDRPLDHIQSSHISLNGVLISKSIHCSTATGVAPGTMQVMVFCYLVVGSRQGVTGRTLDYTILYPYLRDYSQQHGKLFNTCQLKELP